MQKVNSVRESFHGKSPDPMIDRRVALGILDNGGKGSFDSADELRTQTGLLATVPKGGFAILRPRLGMK